MSKERREEAALTAEAERALDSWLARWAARHELSADRAEGIRRAVAVLGPGAGSGGVSVELPREWWRDFSRELRASLRQGRGAGAWRNAARAWRQQGMAA